MLVGMTLAMTAIVGYFITAQQSRGLEELTISKAKLSARVGAQAYGHLLEEGVDNGFFTINDVFDPNREEIKGYNWNGKPKFHTKYDFYTDRVAVSLLDRFLEGQEIAAAVGADKAGYVPTHNTKAMQPVTGDKDKDLAGNRAKLIFDDDVAKKASANETPVLVQDYLRNTGERMWDVSSPILVKGKHWGAFRVIVSVGEVQKHVNSLILTLSLLFGAFAVLSAGLIFLMIQRSIQPLVQLTALADELSTGERLEEPIKPTSIDEVGRMAKSLDRLRASLKAAMARLGE
jgi:HAMP domain-containing protein